MKGLYGLGFLLSSFAACAQTPNTPTMALFELDDYFGEITELSTPAPQAVAAEPVTAKSDEDAYKADVVAISGDQHPEDTSVGTTQQARNEDAVGKFLVWWDDKLSFDDTDEPTTAPAQIAAPPTIESLADAFGKEDNITIAAPSEPADVNIEPIASSKELAPAENVEDAADAPVGAIEPPRQQPATRAWISDEDTMMVGEAINQTQGLPAPSECCPPPTRGLHATVGDTADPRSRDAR